MIDDLLLDVADAQIRDQGLLKSIAPTVAPALRNSATAVAAVFDPLRETNPDDLRPRRVADEAAPLPHHHLTIPWTRRTPGAAAIHRAIGATNAGTAVLILA